MSRVLNTLFYNIDNRLSNSQIIDMARPYMHVTGSTQVNEPVSLDLNDELLKKNTLPVPMTLQVQERALEPILEKEQVQSFIEPAHPDTLFWCIYIAVHGYNDYQQIGRNYGIRELTERQLICAFVKNNAMRIKQTNFKVTGVAIQEIMSELMVVQKQTSMLSLIAMTVFYNINLVIVQSNGKSFCEFLVSKSDDSDAKTYMLHKDKDDKYKIDVDPISLETYTKMKETMYCFEHYDKPIKSIGQYKVDELTQIARKFGLYNETKKYKKAELYELLQTL